MKYFKHKSNQLHVFSVITDGYFYIYSINLRKNHVTFEIDPVGKENKTYNKVLGKLTKKCEETIIEESIVKKSKAFLKKMELNERHYFILKNLEDKRASQVTGVSLTELSDGYRLHHIYEDGEIATVDKYFAHGYLRLSHEEVNGSATEERIIFHLNILFTLGLEPIDDFGLVSFLKDKPFTEDIGSDGDVWKAKDSIGFEEEFSQVSFLKKYQTIKFKNIYINDKKIVKFDNSIYAYPNLSTFNQKEIDVKKYLKEKYEGPVKIEKILDEYKENIPPKKFFSPPKKVKIKFKPLPLRIPKVIVESEELPLQLLQLNRMYFYVNKEGSDPMEWQASFIVPVDFEDFQYVASKSFPLKDFNEAYKALEIEVLEYTTDLDAFFAKRHKYLKKNKLKAVDTKEIFEILSNTTYANLKKEKVKEVFAGANNTLCEVFEHYAIIREYDEFYGKQSYLQFFKDTKARNTWLESQKIKEKEVFDFVLKSADIYAKIVESAEMNYASKEDIVAYMVKKGSINDYAISKLNKVKFDVPKKGWHVKGDLVLEMNKSIIIDGDLIVDGTLFIKKSSSSSFQSIYGYVKGNIKAKNLVLEGGFEYFLVTENIIIDNITVSAFSKDRSLKCGDGSKTKILVHKTEKVYDLSSPFQYDFQVGVLSEGVIDKSIYEVDKRWGFGHIFKYEKVYEFLTQGHPFIAKKLKVVKIDLEEKNTLSFERKMKYWGDYYGEFAGCVNLGIGEDNQVKGNAIHPGGGDWIVHDIRGQSGTYGYNHEDGSIVKVKIKKPKSHGVDYTLKPKKLLVGAEELMYRYQWIAMMFIDWAHRKTVTPYGIWKTPDDLNNAYAKEKEAFVEDPYLALYWLIHFGLSLDTRYEEVKAIIVENSLTEKLDYLEGPLAFFANKDAFYDLKIKNSYAEGNEFDSIFLKRRSYLVWMCHSYEYRGGNDNLDLWWKSIAIYPKADVYMIQRMRWLRNNVNKAEKWGDLDKLLKKEKVKVKEVSLLSYVLACNPNAKNKSKYADLFLKELKENQQTWKGDTQRSFAQIMLKDLKDDFTDKKLLREIVDFYFMDNTACEEYEALAKVMGVKIQSLDKVRKHIEKLETAFEGYDRFDTPEKEKKVYHQKIEEILASLKPKVLCQVAENIKYHELGKRTFRYLFLNDVKGKEKPMTILFRQLCLAGYDIPELFKPEFPCLIKDEKDPNLKIVLSWLSLPESQFRNDSQANSARGGACAMMLTVAHLPSVFKALEKLVMGKKAQEEPKIAEIIFTDILSNNYDNKINPTNHFSKEQIETMLLFTLKFIEKNSKKMAGPVSEAIRTIYYCENPLAEEFVKKWHNSDKVTKMFKGLENFGDEMVEEINDAFESALEFFEARKHYAYLEFKDEKSNKFWEISHYGEGYTVTYGKLGTEGKSTSKDFGSIEAAQKAGDKLVAAKLKKGYISVQKFCAN